MQSAQSKKLFEIGNTYGYDLASLNAHIIKTNLLLSRRQLSEAQQEAEQGGLFSSKYSTENHQLIFFGFKAEIQILLNNVEGAMEPLSQAKRIIEQRRFIPPPYTAPYFVAQFLMDICLLKRAITVTDKPDISTRRKIALHSGKRALRKLRKFAPYRTKTLRLMGEYYWLVGKQKKALKWWDKAIKKGEELGARPDLSRTYFEIGKRLLEPDSKYKKLNGFTADEYLEKAKTMFLDMDLQWDLDELDKVMAASAR
ncbi:MAG: hypothetical protein R2874_06590 [Desulfobacterales bacterium]